MGFVCVLCGAGAEKTEGLFRNNSSHFFWHHLARSADFVINNCRWQLSGLHDTVLALRLGLVHRFVSTLQQLIARLDAIILKC